MHTIHDRESYDDRKCDNDQENYRVPKKKWPREKKVFGHFLLLDGSIWTETMLYDQGISLRRSGYPTCLYLKKKLTQAPSRWPFGRSAGRFRATGPDFGQKIRFLLLHPRFCQWPVCNPRRYLRFCTFGSIFSGRSPLGGPFS